MRPELAMDSRELEKIDVFLKLAKCSSLLDFYEINPETERSVIEARLKERRIWAQAQQANPKFRDVAIWLIKNNSLVRRVLLDEISLYIKVTEERQRTRNLEKLGLFIRGSLLEGRMTSSIKQAIISQGNELGLTAEEVERYLSHELGLKLDPDDEPTEVVFSAPLSTSNQVSADYYSILKISPFAKQEEIYDAYRERYRWARSLRDTDRAREVYRDLDEAWKHLGNPDSRARYDDRYKRSTLPTTEHLGIEYAAPPRRHSPTLDRYSQPGNPLSPGGATTAHAAAPTTAQPSSASPPSPAPGYGNTVTPENLPSKPQFEIKSAEVPGRRPPFKWSHVVLPSLLATILVCMILGYQAYETWRMEAQADQKKELLHTSLHLHIDPPALAVFINDHVVGSGATLMIEDPAPHDTVFRLRVELDGFKTYEEEIVIPGGQTATRRISLELQDKMSYRPKPDETPAELPPALIDELFASRIQALSSCFASLDSQGLPDVVRVELKVWVNSRGQVAGLDMISSNIRSRLPENCLKRQIRALHFPLLSGDYAFFQYLLHIPVNAQDG